MSLRSNRKRSCRLAAIRFMVHQLSKAPHHPEVAAQVTGLLQPAAVDDVGRVRSQGEVRLDVEPQPDPGVRQEMFCSSEPYRGNLAARSRQRGLVGYAQRLHVVA